MTELWQDNMFRQAALGLLAMVIISLCKKFSDYAATNTAFKYGAVVVLSALAAAYSQVWNTPLVEWNQFFKDFIGVGIAALAGYQTLGKAALALIGAYQSKKESE